MSDLNHTFGFDIVSALGIYIKERKHQAIYLRSYN